VNIFIAIIYSFFILNPSNFLPHSVPKGTKSGRTSFKTRKGLVQGKFTGPERFKEALPERRS
jgi:hypothetical protein